MLRTVFFSDLDSPFGLPHLFELLETPGCQVAAVVLGPTGPTETGGRMAVVDRWGRGVVRDLPAATTARGITVLQPDRVDDAAFVAALRALAPDLLISAGFRRILPAGVLRVPAVAALNLHPSALPRVRGRDPFFWNIATGEDATAVTAHLMVERVDAGDIVLQAPVPIDDDETASSLRHKATVESLRLIVPLIDAASRGPLPRRAQDLASGTVFGEPTDRDRTLDWRAPAAAVHRTIRASLDWPGAITHFRGAALRVLGADLGTDQELWNAAAEPGSILKVTAHGVAVKAAIGHVILRRLDVAGQAQPAAAVTGLPGGDGARDRFC